MAAANKRSAAATGGGPSQHVTLSPWELRVLQIMGEGFGEPQTTASVPAFPQNWVCYIQYFTVIFVKNNSCFKFKQSCIEEH